MGRRPSILCISLFSLALTFTPSARAGDIPGIPVVLPPSLMSDFQVELSNDLFSLRSNPDDYRTQQIGPSFALSPEWVVAFDNSILTVRDFNPDLPSSSSTGGRLDQFSASLGYTLYRDHNADTDKYSQLLLGGGFRSFGNFQGTRLQNGIHRLFENELIDLPYVTTKRTDAIVWLRGSREELIFNRDDNRSDAGWKSGYWLDGTVLQTSDGQTDATLGVYSLSRKRDLDVWFGLRRDWREGYERDFVQQIIAENERGLTFVAGLSYGPIRIESAEGLGDNTNGFGRIVFTADRDRRIAAGNGQPHFAYQFSFLFPQVAAQHQLRWLPRAWNRRRDADYQLSAVMDYRTATQAINDETTKFILADQYVAGVEVSQSAAKYENWFSPYLMLGIGYRTEMIEGQFSLAGQRTEEVGSGVAVLDVGTRFNMAAKPDRWLVQFQLGATGWLPFREQAVEFNNQRENLLRSDWSFAIGVSASALF